ncbi:MAG: NepR family anti-sigma factor [Hyphomicrobiaceae bacterium]|nr:NepR family anti-sigma factor [Hyphomicrobiaceae bacterium]
MKLRELDISARKARRKAGALQPAKVATAASDVFPDGGGSSDATQGDRERPAVHQAHEACAEGQADMQDVIGQQLRDLYGKLVAEPLPDRFSLLLAQLRETKPDA